MAVGECWRDGGQLLCADKEQALLEISKLLEDVTDQWDIKVTLQKGYAEAIIIDYEFAEVKKL